MYLADYHVHSRLSPDAAPSMEALARAARAAGMDEICFTDHVDLSPEWGGWKKTREQFQWNDLMEEFVRARTALDGIMTLRLGIELGDVFRDLAEAKRLLSIAPPLDFIIGSVHVLSRRQGYADLSQFHPVDEEQAYAAIEDYLRLVRELASGEENFSVLGHLTLPLRYFNGRRGFALSFDRYEDALREILLILVERGRGLEVNINHADMPLPDHKWLRIYRELGGEIVTIGTDAHTTSLVGQNIRQAQALLRETGFRAFCTFREMIPVFHRL